MAGDGLEQTCGLPTSLASVDAGANNRPGERAPGRFAAVGEHHPEAGYSGVVGVGVGVSVGKGMVLLPVGVGVGVADGVAPPLLTWGR